MQQRVVTGGFIVNNGKFLIAKRADDDSFYPRKWEIPGGKLDQGEDPEEGLKRELKEEVGLEVKIISPISVWDYPNNEKNIQYIEIDYLCEAEDNQEVTLSFEHSDFKWVTFEDIDQFDISPEALERLNGIKNHPLIVPYFGT